MMYTIYIERDSFLHRLDPRVKIISSLLGILAMILFNSPYLLFILFTLLSLSLRFFGKISLREQIKVLKPLIPLIIITIAVWPFILEPRTFGLFIGLGYALRLASMAMITFGLLMTTTQKELILGFIKLKMPYEIGLTLTIALRYIPTLFGLAQTIIDAQKSRGLELEKGSFFSRIKKTVPILIPLIIASIKTAHELSIALESRAFGASKKRTFLHTIQMKGKDYIALIFVLLLFGLALYARYQLGIGYVRLY